MNVLVMSSVPPRKPGATGPEWLDLAAITCATHRAYCDRHGYDYHLDISDIYERVRPTKRGEPIGQSVPIKYKIKFLLFEHFLQPESCGKDYDWVVWLDSDLLITNYEIPLEKFFNSKRAADGLGPDNLGFLGDVILTHDVNGLHATVIMVRRTPYGLGYVYFNRDAGMRYFMEDDWSDQLSQRMALQTPPYSRLIWYHSIKALCAMPPGIYTQIPRDAREIYEWSEGDFALHLSALPLATRVEIAQQYVDRLGLLPMVTP